MLTVQDVQVVAALRQKGLPLDVILNSDIHGRNGLKREHNIPDRAPATGIAELLAQEPPVSKVAASDKVGPPVLSHVVNFDDDIDDDSDRSETSEKPES